MPEIICTTVYQFPELSDAAKEKAADLHRTFMLGSVHLDPKTECSASRRRRACGSFMRAASSCSQVIISRAAS